MNVAASNRLFWSVVFVAALICVHGAVVALGAMWALGGDTSLLSAHAWAMSHFEVYLECTIALVPIGLILDQIGSRIAAPIVSRI